MKKQMVLIIVITVIVILVVIASVLGYLYFSQKNRFGRFPGNRNFRLNQTQIDETNSFFSSNPTQEQITTYCQENRINCMYYCRNNQNMNFCSQMMNFTRRGMMNNSNYTGGMPPPQ